MNQHLVHFQWTRTNMIRLLESLNLDQLNEIPKGFNNNIIWNAGHIHFVQQFLVHKLSGLTMDFPDGFLERYATGSQPESDVVQSEVDDITSALAKYQMQTPEDFTANRFTSFEAFKGSYYDVDFELKNWEQAFAYNNIHEALHFGFMKAQVLCLK